MKVNPKQIAFIDEYFTNGFNVTRAYVTVYGCSVETASKTAFRLMSTPEIRQIIEEKQAEILERANIKKENVLTKLMDIAYDESARNNDRIRALEQINKMLGYFAPIEQNVKITGEQRLFSDDDLTNE